MALFKNNKLTDALKDYKFTESENPAGSVFSDEFEIKMGRFIHRKQRSQKVRLYTMRAVASVLTIAVIGSFFYLLILARNTETQPLGTIEEHPLQIEEVNENQFDPDPEQNPDDVFYDDIKPCDCCLEYSQEECVCNYCGDSDDCECSSPVEYDLVITDENYIEVTTVEELVRAISSNTSIVLKAGLYDISTVVGFESPYIEWQTNIYIPDEKTLLISGVENLTLQAAPGAEVELVTPYRYAEILAFSDCHNINLIGIKAGHTITGDYECDAGVVSFENCSNINIEDCHFYGCGSVGISMSGCSKALITNTIIDDCSRAALIIDDSHDIEFSHSKFINNRAYQYVICIYNSTVVFNYCEISGNKNLGSNVIEIDFFGGNSDVLFNHCVIVDNAMGINSGNNDNLIFMYVYGQYTTTDATPNISIKDSVIELGPFDDYWKDNSVTDLGGNTFR